MLNQKSFLAIIPARGGSKRLPHKNRLLLGGKPLVQWTIDAAKSSAFIDTIVVSSDDAAILDIARELGVVAQNRPASLATDTASSADCVVYVIENLPQQYDYLVLLQPTSPFRTTADIDQAISMAVELESKSVTSVSETEHNPLWSNTLPEDGSLANFMSPVLKNKRSQDLPTYYRLNGAAYVVDIKAFLETEQFIQSKGYAYKMPQERSIDIDTQLDFLLAKCVISFQSTH